MSMATTASTLLSIAALGTRAVSEPARYVHQQTEQGRRRLQESLALGLQARGVFDELYAVATACRTAGWDGYGAAPVQEQTFWQTYRFLKVLPPGTPPPSVGAEADGHLTLEWYRNPSWVLSVSINPEGMIYYAAILGSSKRSGTESFLGDVPEDILRIIHRLFSV